MMFMKSHIEVKDRFSFIEALQTLQIRDEELGNDNKEFLSNSSFIHEG